MAKDKPKNEDKLNKKKQLAFHNDAVTAELMALPMHAILTLIAGGTTIDVMRVPGGWLYMSLNKSADEVVSTTFVAIDRRDRHGRV